MRILSNHVREDTLGDGLMRRTIDNWAHYQDTSNQWHFSDPAAEDAPEAPDDWVGAYEFTKASKRAALQVFAGDSTDPSNTALIGMRLARRPYNWLNLKAINVNPVPMVSEGRRIYWDGLWTNAKLEFSIERARVEKRIYLRAPGHPASFRFALRLPLGHRFEIVNNSLVIYDLYDDAWLQSIPAWGVDANGNQVRVNLVQAADITVAGKSIPTIRLIPNVTDLQNATYPIEVDPTVTISGATAIDDTTLFENNPTFNYGNYARVYSGGVGGSKQTSLFRIDKTQIPAGTITALKLNFNSVSIVHSMSAYVIKDANTWVEGNTTGASETGACSWTYAKHATQAWAGSAGCMTSGTDYDADASPPTMTAAAGANTFTLKAAWATAWRDNTRVNNGFALLANASATGYMRSTDTGTNPPTIDIDYTPAAFGGNYYQSIHAIRREPWNRFLLTMQQKSRR